MIKAENWKNYQCIDAGEKEKLERWNNVILRRPDPTAIWPMDVTCQKWHQADGHYHRSKQGGGSWQFNRKLPEFWTIDYKDLTFKVSPTGFKHTGIFPEQAVNWDWMSNLIQHEDREIRVLNLFAYTGCATMACSKAGASEVVHVDASKGMVQWAKENMHLSHLENNTIRFIVDDVIKFVQREKRRGHTYHGIVMDPPSYGRGPNGEMWRLEDQFQELIQATLDVLDENALFYCINCYTTGFSKTALENMVKTTLPASLLENGQLEVDEIGLPIEHRDLVLPCGIVARWSKKQS